MIMRSNFLWARYGLRKMSAKHCTLLLLVFAFAFVGCQGRHETSLAVERFEYNPDGRLKSWTTPNSDTILYQYNESGLLTRIKYSWLSSVDFHYNAADDLVAVVDKSGTTQFGHDPFGRLSKVVSSNGKELTYEYDPWGRIVLLSVSGGYQIRYGRDMFGHVTSVDDGHGRTTYEYREHEVIRVLPNGVKTTFTFSLGGRIIGIVHQKPDSNLICSFNYSYRADGKLLEVNESTASAQRSERYEYDLLGRLSSVQASDRAQVAYSYDSVGNRISETSGGHTIAYEYDFHGRLAKKGSEVYKYDTAGNLVYKRNLVTRQDVEYQYDIDNRLVTVLGATKIRYSYDGLGNRIKREVAGNASYYLNDLSSGLAQTVAVFDEAGKPKRQYVLADSRIATRDVNGETLYYLTDRTGSVRYIVDERAQIVRKWEYSPFGSPLQSCEGGEAYGFDGENWDQDAELLYLRRRYYDPSVGRFISADPFRGDLGNPRSLNRYVYASNDPINRRDPSGLQDDGGRGFSFDAPVIDTGAFSGSSVSQNFLDSWGNRSQLQFQTSNSGLSIVDQAKNAVSNLLQAPAQAINGLNNPISNIGQPVVPSIQAAGQALVPQRHPVWIRVHLPAPPRTHWLAPSKANAAITGGQTTLNASQRLESGAENGAFASALSLSSDHAQSGLRTGLAITDVAANLAANAAKVGDTFMKGEGLVGPLVSAYDYSQANTPLEKANAGYGLGLSAGAYGLGLAQPELGLPLAALGAGGQTLETAMQAAGVPKETIGAVKYQAYSDALHPIARMTDAISNLSQSITSGLTSDITKAATQSGLTHALNTLGVNPWCSQDITQSVGGIGQPPVGGVRLDRTAELIGTLGSINGALYDPKSGRILLVGDKNTVLPPMRLDDLAVALRAAYSGGPYEPSMTIDPDPRNPKGPTMNVIFFGQTQNTHFGWVMFEADRLMKTYSVGKDNISKAPVQSQIKGYFNVVQLGQANDSESYKTHLWSRFWLVPEDIKLRVSSDGKAVLFGDTTIRVRTETMKWTGGKLMPAHGERDEPAEYFAKHFSENYDEYAKERKIYGELKRLAQIYALTKWMKKAGIQIDSHWVDSLATPPYETPRTTPSISNALSRQWKTGNVTRTETNSVFGGTDLGVKVVFKARDHRADAFAATVLKTLTVSSGQMAADLTLDGKPQTAIAIPTAIPPDYGSFRTSSLDLAEAAPGGITILLRRAYTSYHAAPTAFGRGWSLLLPRLFFAGVTDKGKIQTISLEGEPETTVTVQQFHMTDDFGNLNERFTEHFVDQDWKRIGFKPTGLSHGYRGLYPNADGTYSVMLTNGDEWRFNAQGNLQGVRSGTTFVEYHHDPTTARLVGISSGAVWIRLHYDASGRIDQAQSSRGGDVRYTYDSKGHLNGASSKGRKVAYLYDRSHQLIQLSTNDVPVLRNEYDDQGHFTRQLDAAGNVFQQMKMEETKDGGRRIVQTIGSVVTTSKYDNLLRPLDIRNGNNAVTYAYYPNGTLKNIAATRSDNSRIELQISEDRREIRTIDLRGTSRGLLYDERGRLLQMSINGSVYVTFTRDSAGRPLVADYGKFRERYRYDDKGRIVQYTVDSDVPEPTTEQISFAYNTDDSVAKIATSGYGSICIARETGKAFTLQGGERTLRTVLDSEGRIAEMIGPDQQAIEYRYGTDHLIEKLAYRSGGQEGHALFRGGRLQELKDLSGGRNQYEYTENGRLATVIDAYGAKTQYSYDDQGRLTDVVMPTGRRVAYAYDPGRLTLRIRE